ncbi:TPA: PIN domain-containing protein [Bacillus cereus]|nr:PIN domain-containing protein [Bacillus cereus]
MNRTSVSFDISRGNWGNQHIFPDMLYIDTNSIIDIFEQRTHGQLIEDYLNELIKRDGMIIWSQHTIDEIIDFVHYDYYAKLAKQKNIKRSQKAAPYKIVENTVTDAESSEIAEKVMIKVDTIQEYLEQFGSQVVQEEREVNELARSIYIGHGNNRKDCKHVAAANLEGTNNILTQDSGFLRFPNMNVYGSSLALVNGYKTIQGPSGYIDLSQTFASKQEMIDEEDEQDTAI